MKKWILPDWPAPAHIKAFTTTKNGWATLGGPAKSAESTAALKTLLALPANPVWLYQTHSAIALEANPMLPEQEADASFSRQTNTICTILTADCLPILICDRQGTQVAAIHAGWRGLANGIIEASLKNMNAKPEDLLVWFGPAIGPQQFEVGMDVYEAFISKHAESAHAFLSQGQNKWLANLYELAKIRLNLQGVKQLYGGDYCTFSQPEYFYSYRRDQGKTGRMASVIWISDATLLI